LIISQDTSLKTERTALISSCAAHNEDPDLTLLDRAFDTALASHLGQYRKSGEIYATHVVAVAQILADLGVDATTLAAALLHDVVEDTTTTTEELSLLFGKEIAAIVDGVTKLSELEFDSKETAQAATIRKMFIAMASDWRVLLIKLADRLHNMRTLAAMGPAHQARVARETLDVYAPLADRLGLQPLKSELEDLCFATLNPKAYAELAHLVTIRSPERESYVEGVTKELREVLAANGISAEVYGRPKHLYSIYRKMLPEKPFDDIYDLVGLRIIAPTITDCWASLGAIHALWTPIPGRFKDYINTPKFNLYQSLHTTVIGPAGKSVEVQVRTPEMHRRAEFGAAAHWGYKEHATTAELAWMQRLVEIQDDPDPLSFLEALKLDLGSDEVYVFTPKGKVVALVEGSTPIDFAYAVHTEVGHHCVGARVNGRLVPLDTVLNSADAVEIITGTRSSPSRDWLKTVRSTRARTKIRQWFLATQRQETAASGHAELTSALKSAHLSLSALSSLETDSLLAHFGLADVEALYAHVGSGQISVAAVITQLSPKEPAVEKLPRPRPLAPSSIEGLGDVLLVLAKCCQPLPTDNVVGFITQGRGVSVHQISCTNATDLARRHPERIIEVSLQKTVGLMRAVLDVYAFDRPGLLLDTSKAIAELHINVTESSSSNAGESTARMHFVVELKDPDQLTTLSLALRDVDGVYDVVRPGT
jgi:GTP pyrophosphokinase